MPVSAEATGWVYRHSPYRGATFAVHHAMADSANDQHGHLVWLALGTLAKKARVSRNSAIAAVDCMVNDGLLTVVEDHRSDKAGVPSCYRFMFADVPVTYETRGGAQPPRTPARSPRTGGAQPPRTGCAVTAQGVRGDRAQTQVTQVDPKVDTPGVGDAARALMRRVYDKRRPKPTSNFMGAAKIAERLLVAGHTEAAVERAFMTAPTFTTGALEFQLNRVTRPTQQQATQSAIRGLWDEVTGGRH